MDEVSCGRELESSKSMDAIYETPIMGARNQHIKCSVSNVKFKPQPENQPMCKDMKQAVVIKSNPSNQEFKSINSSFDPFASDRSYQ